MGREGQKGHRWQPSDERAMHKAMDDLEPLMAHYERQGGQGRAWWDAVAGRLAPDVLVTGAACKRRWELILARQTAVEAAAKAADLLPADAAPPPEDSWERTARRVDEYERTAGEATLDTVTETAAVVGQLARATERHTRMLVALCHAWDVPVPRDGDPEGR